MMETIQSGRIIFDPKGQGTSMKTGTFSVSLNVRDAAESQGFYEKLGFTVFMGKAEEGWLIMKNEAAVIGLFQGMLEENGLTFNPGWDQDGQPTEDWQDVRLIREELRGQGLAILEEGGEDEGPGWFIVKDPDGNRILFDQHR